MFTKSTHDDLDFFLFVFDCASTGWFQMTFIFYYFDISRRNRSHLEDSALGENVSRLRESLSPGGDPAPNPIVRPTR